jgi:hypothetical protein
MVEDLISGLLEGSPYVLLTGSYWNSSGTTKVKNTWITVLQCNDCERSHMTDTLPIQPTFPLLRILNFIISTSTTLIFWILSTTEITQYQMRWEYDYTFNIMNKINHLLSWYNLQKTDRFILMSCTHFTGNNF